MRKKTLGSIPAFLVLLAARMAAAPCAPSDSALCLSAGRFQVAVHWQDTRGRSGDGRAVSLTADTGYFWFFSPSNIELIVKVLDARAVNGKFWVFFGALSNVQYDLTVTDSATGSVKTYRNPQGQFASVGDTGAFEGAADAPPADVRVIADGSPGAPGSLEAVEGFIDGALARTSTKSAADFVPCPAAGNRLALNSCRFVVSVEWEDTHGRSGLGVPVQLTGDTGYFWFFSPANVELVVKVLDARSVNGDFWVFFGALSNVAYTVTVGDRLSGAVRTYTNAQGAFASVGDTGAFDAGLAVHPVADANATVMADFDSAGGTLAATGADGTKFLLEIPQDALGSQTTIRMTPLTAVNGLPLSKGLIGGVQLEPEGLGLLVPATLTITVPGGLPPETAGFSYIADGQNFALDVDKVAGDTMTLQIFHFSGYGGGVPGQSDSFGSTFLDPIAGFQQRAMQILEKGREHRGANGEVIPPEWTAEEVQDAIAALTHDVFVGDLLPAINSLTSSCDKSKIAVVGGYLLHGLHVLTLFVTETEAVKRDQESVTSAFINLLEKCLKKAHDDCVRLHDPFQVWDMVMIERQLQLFGVETEGLFDAGGLKEKCLRFQLEFDSTIHEENSPDESTRHVKASVPLRLVSDQSTGDFQWRGSADLEWVSIEATPPAKRCTLTYTTESGYFDVDTQNRYARLLPVRDKPEFYAGFVETLDIYVIHEPGHPQETGHLTCQGGSGTVDLPTTELWSLDFHVLHDNEKTNDGTMIRDWDGGGSGDVFVQKTYSRSRLSDIVRDEITTYTVRHTPE